MLDKDELLHLALQEMREGSTENAIGHLKDCLKQDPQNANAQYLLGALHAELGMYERAAKEMETALDMNPDMPTARFQLGLLHMTSGNADKAKSIWNDLVKLGNEHFFYLFKEGIIDLSENKFESSIEKLKQGIAINTENEALNNDMLNMISRAETALQGGDIATNTASTIATETSEKPKEQSKPVSLSAYESQDDSDINH